MKVTDFLSYRRNVRHTNEQIHFINSDKQFGASGKSKTSLLKLRISLLISLYLVGTWPSSNESEKIRGTKG